MPFSFNSSRLLYHNYSTFYSDHFEARVVKSEGRVSFFLSNIYIFKLRHTLDDYSGRTV